MRTSPLENVQQVLAPRCGLVRDMPSALEFAREGNVRRLALADLSGARRTGLKGRDAAAWLARQSIALPATNHWEALPDHGVAARLGSGEFLLEDGPRGDACARIEAKLARGQAGVYPVQRQDAELLLTGSNAGDVLAQTCNVNFRAVDVGAKELFMTSMAGVNVLVISQSWSGLPVTRIWCDPTFAPYLWRTLLDIVVECGGGPAGLDRLQATQSRNQGDAA